MDKREIVLFFNRIFSKMSIKYKLCTGLTLILILGFSTINILNYTLAANTLKNSIKKDFLPSIVNDIYHEIKSSINSSIQISSLMASDTFLKDWIIEGEKDIKKIKKYLWEIKQKYNFFSVFLVSDKTQKYYHFKGLHKVIDEKDEHDIWYYNFVNKGSDYNLDIDKDEASDNTLAIFINHRLNNYNGNFIGATGVGLRMTEIGKIFYDFEKKYNKIIYLVDKKGVVQVHSDQRLVETKNIRDEEGLSEIADEILLENHTTIIKEYNSTKGNIILMAKYIEEFDWFLIVEHSTQSSLNKIKFNFVQNVIIGFIVTILVVIINIFMVNFFQNKLEKLASTDELTSLANRRYFNIQAKRDIAQTARNGFPISFLMIDIDHFKKVNDNYGHDIGDIVLQNIAEKLKRGLRSCDLAGRIGGEEFAVILPYTNKNGALESATRIKNLISYNQIPVGKNISISISVSIGGVAVVDANNKTLKEILGYADKALYRAKNTGRDKICFYDEED